MDFDALELMVRAVLLTLIVTPILLVEEIQGLFLKQLAKFLLKLMSIVMKIMTVRWILCAIGSLQQRNNKVVKDVKKCTTLLMVLSLDILEGTI